MGICAVWLLSYYPSYLSLFILNYKGKKKNGMDSHNNWNLMEEHEEVTSYLQYPHTSTTFKVTKISHTFLFKVYWVYFSVFFDILFLLSLFSTAFNSIFYLMSSLKLQ